MFCQEPCPDCSNKLCDVCDNSCGTSYCRKCKVYFYLVDGQVVKGHSPKCGHSDGEDSYQQIPKTTVYAGKCSVCDIDWNDHQNMIHEFRN